MRKVQARSKKDRRRHLVGSMALGSEGQTHKQDGFALISPGMDGLSHSSSFLWVGRVGVPSYVYLLPREKA